MYNGPRRLALALGSNFYAAAREKVRAQAFCKESSRFSSRFVTGEQTMSDHVYRIIQVAGSSGKSIEDAIQNAVGRASRTLRQLGWFEVVETRGHVEDGKVAHYQVTLKVGFTLDDDD
jgi:dodecin